MVEMSTKVLYTLREDKQEIQKQLGCMNGIFQLFDLRYLLGERRRHSHHQQKLPQAQSGNGKEFNNVLEKQKEKIPVKEKQRLSIESSRNSFSSSCLSLDCSKRVHTEPSSICPSIVSEPSSPTSHRKQDLPVKSTDIKDVVKDSMTRKPRVVSVKTVAKDERKGPTMTHVDSPRPLQHPKHIPYERKDQNLAKLREISISRGVKEVKEISRFSYDEWESPYKLKSISNMKESPRLSLDSKQSSIKNLSNVANQSQTNEPGSNKRPPSSLVARLMGLDGLNDFINGGETLNIKSYLDDKSIKPKAPNPLTRISLEPALWKQEVKQLANKKASDRKANGYKSVYGQIEKRLTEVEFKTSGKDLRALKQILEAIQRTKIRLEKTDNSSSAIKPDNLQKVKKINNADGKKYTAGRGSARNLTPTETKATGRTKKPVSPSRTPEYLTGENYCNSRNPGTVSPRLQRSKNGVEKQSVHGIRKQSNGHRINLSQQSDTVSFPSESDASVGSQNEPEITSTDCTQQNKNKVAERLTGYKPKAELAMLTMEQPSPVSVLDAFYTEDTPSPIQKKSYAFKDDEDLFFDEREWSQVGINNLVRSTELHQPTSEFNHIKLENVKHLVHQIELLSSISDEATIEPHEVINGDHKYIKEIVIASGLFKNIDCAITIVHLHPTGSLINPELFVILEKTKEYNTKSEKIRRKMIFDTVNNILIEKLARSASSGLRTSKRKGRILNEEKLVEELCLEINNLETNRVSGLYDEILNIITEDVNKKSEDWDDNCNEVPALVLDIERLILKDLISEIVNAEVAGLQDRSRRHRRQLCLM